MVWREGGREGGWEVGVQMNDILDSPSNKAPPPTWAVWVWREAVTVKGSFAFQLLITSTQTCFLLREKCPPPPPTHQPNPLGVLTISMCAHSGCFACVCVCVFSFVQIFRGKRDRTSGQFLSCCVCATSFEGDRWNNSG